MRVALDWTLDLVFPRDITLLKVLLKTTVPMEADDHSGSVRQPAARGQSDHARQSP